MAKIAVITPISHLKGITELLLTKGRVLLYEESTKKEVREMLLTTKADIILCNPNQQTYKIDKELLENSNVKLINTCISKIIFLMLIKNIVKFFFQAFHSTRLK